MSDRPTPETSQQSIRPETAATAGVDLVVPAAFASRLERQRDELMEALDYIDGIASWHCDMEADPDDECPDDGVAHANGLIRQKIASVREDKP